MSAHAESMLLKHMHCMLPLLTPHTLLSIALPCTRCIHCSRMPHTGHARLPLVHHMHTDAPVAESEDACLTRPPCMSHHDRPHALPVVQCSQRQRTQSLTQGTARCWEARGAQWGAVTAPQSCRCCHPAGPPVKCPPPAAAPTTVLVTSDAALRHQQEYHEGPPRQG